MDEENMVDYLERARANIEAEVSYEVDRELTVVQALVGIGLELRRLNKQLKRWDDGNDHAPAVRILTYLSDA